MSNLIMKDEKLNCPKCIKHAKFITVFRRLVKGSSKGKTLYTDFFKLKIEIILEATEISFLHNLKSIKKAIV